jgi:hypothetical protein
MGARLMGCVLRAAGKDFDVDAFLKKSNLEALAVFRRGEPKSRNNPRRINRQSSVNIEVSNASFDNVKRQVKDTINFLTENKTEIQRLLKFKGVEGAELDFASNKNDQFLQEVEFPSELLALASSLCLSIKLSQYVKPLK